MCTISTEENLVNRVFKNINNNIISRQHWSQLYATIIANFTLLVYGIGIGWASPNLPRLQSKDTPLAEKRALTLDEVSWLGSLYLLGGLAGTLIFGWITEKFGRKPAILMAAVPLAICWVIKVFGTNVTHLYIARLFLGIGGGGAFIAIPLYVSEISANKIRGALGCMVEVIRNFGIVVGYAINSYLDYYTVPYIALAILAIFCAGFPFAAESPKYLMTKGKFEDAERSLRYFKGHDEQFQNELLALKSIVAADDQPKITLKDFSSKSAKKAIVISLFLNFLAVLNGVCVIITYSQTVFKEAGSTLSPEVSSIIIGFIFLVGASLSSVLSDRAGRKILMGISSSGCAVSLAVLAVYSYLKDGGHSIQDWTWIPLVCLSAFMFLGSIGIMSLVYVIMAEVLSQNIRGIVSTICLIVNWLLAFISVKFFPLLLDAIGMQGCMLIFSCICISGTLFVVFVLPETKGKCIESIIEELDG